MGETLRDDVSVWAVVPAAGVGARMGGEIPKQYLPLAGRPIITHTLERLCNHPRIRGVAVALAAEDRWWAGLSLVCERPPVVAPGGAERRDSVLNGLAALGDAADTDWVLVHDAVRPCLRAADVDRLLDTLLDDPVGGLLAVPVKDTMKRAGEDGRIVETVSRESLWHALTPQMFRVGALRDAIRRSVEEGVEVTDEAQAMERAGARPRLVEGHEENIKITRPEDLALAETFLAGRRE